MWTRLIAQVATEGLSAVASLLYPKRCAGCEGALDELSTEDFCTTCLSRLTPLSAPFCQVCALPIEGIATRDVRCSNCIGQKLAFDFAYAPFRNRGPVRQLILNLKYGQQSWASAPLARLLSPAREETRIATLLARATLVPIPLHPRRERERGYNQSALIAERFAKATGRPVENLLLRTRYTTTQTTLDRDQRLGNLLGAFSLRRSSRSARIPDTIILVDDVLTTCATSSECARVLRDAGACQIVALAVARA